MRRIVRLCEGVPLALAVVAGVIESVAAAPDRPDSLDPLAAELERARYGLESVSPDERAVFAALRVSHAHLPARQRRVLYALALTGLVRFDLGLIAAVGGLPLRRGPRHGEPARRPRAAGDHRPGGRPLANAPPGPPLHPRHAALAGHR